MGESGRDESWGEKVMRLRKLMWWAIGLVCIVLGFTAGTRYRYRGISGSKLERDMKMLLTKYFDGLGFHPNDVAICIDDDGLYHLSFFRKSNISDLSVLKGIPLVGLKFPDSQVTDLTPLRKFKTLRYLDMCQTKISDLSPLSGLPLDILNISVTDVRDLSPITNMPLRVLEIVHTPITNADVILQTNISYLMFDPERMPKELLDKIRAKKIEVLNGLDHDRFWKNFDARQARELISNMVESSKE